MAASLHRNGSEANSLCSLRQGLILEEDLYVFWKPKIRRNVKKIEPENEAEGTKAESSGLANQRKQVKKVKCSRLAEKTKQRPKKSKIQHMAVFTQKQEMYIFPEFKDESFCTKENPWSLRKQLLQFYFHLDVWFEVWFGLSTFHCYFAKAVKNSKHYFSWNIKSECLLNVELICTILAPSWLTKFEI